MYQKQPLKFGIVYNINSIIVNNVHNLIRVIFLLRKKILNQLNMRDRLGVGFNNKVFIILV